MEFNRLLSQAISFYGEPNNKEIKDRTIIKTTSKINTKSYKSVLKEKELDDLIKKLNEQSIIAVDTETSSLNPQEANLVGISVSYAPNIAYYIPLDHKKVKGIKKEIVLKKLKVILEDPSIKKVGQNIKYDFIIFKNNGVELNPVDDTMLLSYTLDAGNNRHNMDTLSELHLGHKTISYKDLVGTGKKQLNFTDVDIKAATEYAAEDADVTLRLYEILSNRVSDEKLEKIYDVFEKPMITILSKLETNGIKVDDSYLKKLSKKFESRLKKIEKDIYKLSGKKFNIGSPKQLGEIIYNDLKIAKLKKTKKGSLATSAKILEDLALTGHKFPNLVLEWRQVSKLKSTYTDALQDHINKKTKRVHTSFLLAATNTGRLASSDPNLQNIPIKSEDGREIRKAFIANEDCRIVAADYSQIELRILAHVAKIENLIKGFKNNNDIHSLTAMEVFQVNESELTTELRRRAKTINFGLIYGISSYGLSRQLKIDPNSALAHNNYGNLLSSQERIQEALGCYKKAIQIKPDFALANNNLGTILSSLGKVEESLKFFKQAVKLNPNFELALVNLGITELELNNINNAEKYFLKAIEVKQDYQFAYSNLSVSYTHLTLPTNREV